MLALLATAFVFRIEITFLFVNFPLVIDIHQSLDLWRKQFL